MDWNEIFISVVDEAICELPHGYELEIHQDGTRDVPGWYAYKYSEEYGCATPLNDSYTDRPLITFRQEKLRHVNVEELIMKYRPEVYLS